MKTKGKFLAVLATGALALVGTAYAAWTFNAEVDTTFSSTGAVTAAIEAKDVTASQTTLYLICDAPTAADNTNDNLVDGEGIYWSTKNDKTAKDNKITEITLTGTVNQDDEDILDFSGYTGKFTITADAIDTTYVDFDAVNVEKTIDVDSPNGDCVYTYELPTIGYDTVPTCVADVTAMESELAGKTITFTVTFNVDHVND